MCQDTRTEDSGKASGLVSLIGWIGLVGFEAEGKELRVEGKALYFLTRGTCGATPQ